QIRSKAKTRLEQKTSIAEPVASLTTSEEVKTTILTPKENMEKWVYGTLDDRTKVLAQFEINGGRQRIDIFNNLQATLYTFDQKAQGNATFTGYRDEFINNINNNDNIPFVVHVEKDGQRYGGRSYARSLDKGQGSMDGGQNTDIGQEGAVGLRGGSELAGGDSQGGVKEEPKIDIAKLKQQSESQDSGFSKGRLLADLGFEGQVGKEEGKDTATGGQVEHEKKPAQQPQDKDKEPQDDHQGTERKALPATEEENTDENQQNQPVGQIAIVKNTKLPNDRDANEVNFNKPGSHSGESNRFARGPTATRLLNRAKALFGVVRKSLNQFKAPKELGKNSAHKDGTKLYELGSSMLLLMVVAKSLPQLVLAALVIAGIAIIGWNVAKVVRSLATLGNRSARPTSKGLPKEVAPGNAFVPEKKGNGKGSGRGTAEALADEGPYGLSLLRRLLNIVEDIRKAKREWLGHKKRGPPDETDHRLAQQEESNPVKLAQRISYVYQQGKTVLSRLYNSLNNLINRPIVYTMAVAYLPIVAMGILLAKGIYGIDAISRISGIAAVPMLMLSSAYTRNDPISEAIEALFKPNDKAQKQDSNPVLQETIKRRIYTQPIKEIVEVKWHDTKVWIVTYIFNPEHIIFFEGDKVVGVATSRGRKITSAEASFFDLPLSSEDAKMIIKKASEFNSQNPGSVHRIDSTHSIWFEGQCLNTSVVLPSEIQRLKSMFLNDPILRYLLQFTEGLSLVGVHSLCEQGCGDLKYFLARYNQRYDIIQKPFGCAMGITTIMHEIIHHIFDQLLMAETNILNLEKSGRKDEISAEDREKVRILNEIRDYFRDRKDLLRLGKQSAVNEDVNNPKDYLYNETLAYLYTYVFEFCSTGSDFISKRFKTEDITFLANIGLLPADFSYIWESKDKRTVKGLDDIYRALEEIHNREQKRKEDKERERKEREREDFFKRQIREGLYNELTLTQTLNVPEKLQIKLEKLEYKLAELKPLYVNANNGKSIISKLAKVLRDFIGLNIVLFILLGNIPTASAEIIGGGKGIIAGYNAASLASLPTAALPIIITAIVAMAGVLAYKLWKNRRIANGGAGLSSTAAQSDNDATDHRRLGLSSRVGAAIAILLQKINKYRKERGWFECHGLKLERWYSSILSKLQNIALFASILEAGQGICEFTKMVWSKAMKVGGLFNFLARSRKVFARHSIEQRISQPSRFITEAWNKLNLWGRERSLAKALLIIGALSAFFFVAPMNAQAGTIAQQAADASLLHKILEKLPLLTAIGIISAGGWHYLRDYLGKVRAPRLPPHATAVKGFVTAAFVYAILGFFYDTNTFIIKSETLDLSANEINIEQTASDIQGTVIANGNYLFTNNKDQRVASGWLVINGKQINSFNSIGYRAAGAVFLKTKDGRYAVLRVVRVKEGEKEVNSLDKTLAQAGLTKADIEDALQAGPMAIHNGAITELAQRWSTRGAKAVIGINREGKLVVVTSSKWLLGVVGPSAYEIAQAAQKMGIENGMFVDAGVTGTLRKPVSVITRKTNAILPIIGIGTLLSIFGSSNAFAATTKPISSIAAKTLAGIIQVDANALIALAAILLISYLIHRAVRTLALRKTAPIRAPDTYRHFLSRKQYIVNRIRHILLEDSNIKFPDNAIDCFSGKLASLDVAGQGSADNHYRYSENVEELIRILVPSDTLLHASGLIHDLGKTGPMLDDFIAWIVYLSNKSAYDEIKAVMALFSINSKAVDEMEAHIDIIAELKRVNPEYIEKKEKEAERLIGVGSNVIFGNTREEQIRNFIMLAVRRGHISIADYLHLLTFVPQTAKNHISEETRYWIIQALQKVVNPITQRPFDVQYDSMRKFWDSHTYWSFETLNQFDLPKELIDLVRFHHVLEGTFRSEFNKVSEDFARRCAYLIVADKYEAFINRMGMSHGRAVAALRGIMTSDKVKGLAHKEVFFEAIERLDNVLGQRKADNKDSIDTIFEPRGLFSSGISAGSINVSLDDILKLVGGIFSDKISALEKDIICQMLYDIASVSYKVTLHLRPFKGAFTSIKNDKFEDRAIRHWAERIINLINMTPRAELMVKRALGYKAALNTINRIPESMIIAGCWDDVQILNFLRRSLIAVFAILQDSLKLLDNKDVLNVVYKIMASTELYKNNRKINAAFGELCEEANADYKFALKFVLNLDKVEFIHVLAHEVMHNIVNRMTTANAIILPTREMLSIEEFLADMAAMSVLFKLGYTAEDVQQVMHRLDYKEVMKKYADSSVAEERHEAARVQLGFIYNAIKNKGAVLDAEKLIHLTLEALKDKEVYTFAGIIKKALKAYSVDVFNSDASPTLGSLPKKQPADMRLINIVSSEEVEKILGLTSNKKDDNDFAGFISLNKDLMLVGYEYNKRKDTLILRVVDTKSADLGVETVVIHGTRAPPLELAALLSEINFVVIQHPAAKKIFNWYLVNQKHIPILHFEGTAEGILGLGAAKVIALSEYIKNNPSALFREIVRAYLDIHPEDSEEIIHGIAQDIGRDKWVKSRGGDIASWLRTWQRKLFGYQDEYLTKLIHNAKLHYQKEKKEKHNIDVAEIKVANLIYNGVKEIRLPLDEIDHSGFVPKGFGRGHKKTIQTVRLENIKYNRESIDPERVWNLIESLKNGVPVDEILSNITLIKIPGTFDYRVESGNRRIYLARLLGKRTIVAKVTEEPLPSGKRIPGTPRGCTGVGLTEEQIRERIRQHIDRGETYEDDNINKELLKVQEENNPYLDALVKSGLLNKAPPQPEKVVIIQGQASKRFTFGAYILDNILYIEESYLGQKTLSRIHFHEVLEVGAGLHHDFVIILENALGRKQLAASDEQNITDKDNVQLKSQLGNKLGIVIGKALMIKKVLLKDVVREHLNAAESVEEKRRLEELFDSEVSSFDHLYTILCTIKKMAARIIERENTNLEYALLHTVDTLNKAFPDLLWKTIRKEIINIFIDHHTEDVSLEGERLKEAEQKLKDKYQNYTNNIGSEEANERITFMNSILEVVLHEAEQEVNSGKSAIASIMEVFESRIKEFKAMSEPKMQDMGDELERMKILLIEELLPHRLRRKVEKNEEIFIFNEKVRAIENKYTEFDWDKFNRYIEGMITTRELSSAYLVFKYIIKHRRLSSSQKKALFELVESLEPMLERERERSQEEVILVAEDNLSFYDTVKIQSEYNVKGVVFEKGAATVHCYIIFTNKGIPAVIGARGIYRLVESGDVIAVDSNANAVYLNPNEIKMQEIDESIKRYEELKGAFKEGSRLEVRLFGQYPIRIYANADTPSDITSAIKNGAEGIGLVRTAGLYEEKVPSKEELKTWFLKVASATELPVVIRIFDREGDKLMAAAPISNYFGIHYYFHEGKPLLGDFLEAFLIALKLSKNKNLRLMVPMISSRDDVDRFFEILDPIKESFKKEWNISNKDLKELFKIGAMVETTGAVDIIDYLIEKFDFLSIGTNDLIGSIFDVSRQDPDANRYYEKLWAQFLDRVNTIARAVSEFNKSSLKKQVDLSVCGEKAHDEAFIDFMAMHVPSLATILTLSMASPYVPKIKEFIRNVKEEDIQQLKTYSTEAFNDAALEKVKESYKRIEEKLSQDQEGTFIVPEGGLHVLPAGKLIEIIKETGVEVYIKHPEGTDRIDNIISILGLGLEEGIKIQFIVEPQDKQKEFLAAVKKVLEGEEKTQGTSHDIACTSEKLSTQADKELNNIVKEFEQVLLALPEDWQMTAQKKIVIDVLRELGYHKAADTLLSTTVARAPPIMGFRQEKRIIEFLNRIREFERKYHTNVISVDLNTPAKKIIVVIHQEAAFNGISHDSFALEGHPDDYNREKEQEVVKAIINYGEISILVTPEGEIIVKHVENTLPDYVTLSIPEFLRKRLREYKYELELCDNATIYMVREIHNLKHMIKTQGHTPDETSYLMQELRGYKARMLSYRNGLRNKVERIGKLMKKFGYKVLSLILIPLALLGVLPAEAYAGKTSTEAVFLREIKIERKTPYEGRVNAVEIMLESIIERMYANRTSQWRDDLIKFVAVIVNHESFHMLYRKPMGKGDERGLGHVRPSTAKGALRHHSVKNDQRIRSLFEDISGCSYDELTDMSSTRMANMLTNNDRFALAVATIYVVQGLKGREIPKTLDEMARVWLRVYNGSRKTNTKKLECFKGNARKVMPLLKSVFTASLMAGFFFGKNAYAAGAETTVAETG
ncbi:MAG: phosphodiester glycosidase family protein, partial [Candidatus Omnitrophica bacterium]|nr:phosphodiester glycosidase family protein [Candidatus Omnitrophota bacterium]